MKQKTTLSMITGLSQHALKVAYRDPNVNWYDFLIRRTARVMREVYEVNEMHQLVADSELYALQQYRQKSIDFWSDNLKEVSQ